MIQPASIGSWTELVLDSGGDAVCYGPMTRALSGDAEEGPDGVSVFAGRIWGRTAVVVEYGRSGYRDGSGSVSNAKVERAIRVAESLGASLVLYATGARHHDPDIPFYRERRDLVGMLARFSRNRPLIGVADGPVRGARSLMLGTCDVVIGLPGTTISLSNTGPRGVSEDQDAELERCGGIDIRAKDPSDGAELVRRLLHLMTESDTGSPGEGVPDPSAAGRVVPENPRRAIDGRQAIDAIVDIGSRVTLLPRYGGSLQTALGRLDGCAVGIVASHSMVKAGAIDTPAADKLARFTAMCDRFSLPIVLLTDVPGLLAGPEAEATALNRHSTRPFVEQVRATVPHLSVIMRRAYGQGMIIMGLGAHFPSQPLRLMWPTGQFGGMGLKGAASITATSSVRRGAVDHDGVHDRLSQHGAPSAMASRFEVDEVIDPEETRERLRVALRLARSDRSVGRPTAPREPW